VLVPLPRLRGAKSWVLSCGALALVGVVVAAVTGAPGPTDGAPAVRRPPPDEVIATVDARDRGARAAAAAGDVAAAAALVRADLAAARATGDPRPLGRARATLAAWAAVAEPPAPLGLLRATVAQALHDFPAARADLDRLIAAAPDDAQARLTRAVVALVTGDRATAAADCAAVEQEVGALWGAACAAPLAATRGGGPAGRQRLRAALASAGDHPARAWALTALAELERQLGDDRAAELALRQAVAADAADLYAQGALADLLLDAGRPAEVVGLLAEASAEHLVVRRAIALHQSAPGSAAAAADRAALTARFADRVDPADELHLRERARFRLAIVGDARGALADAVANWAQQRELADARLVLAAARAAGDRAAAAPVLAWLDAAGVDDAVSAGDRAALGGAP
jgi:hypothetical protein